MQLEGKERDALCKVRINQGIFREKLLKKYGRCCLCGVNNSSLLIASHIKPWADSEPAEKLDENNGLLLCPNHDALFDGGFISFEDGGEIIISNQLDYDNSIFTNVNKNMKLKGVECCQKYLKYHRDHILKRGADDKRN